MLAKTVFSEFNVIPTISRKFLYFTRPLNKNLINTTHFEQDRNNLTNYVQYNVYNDELLNRSKQIQSFVFIKDYTNNVALQEYCRLTTIDKINYLNYSLKIEENINYIKLNNLKEIYISPHNTIQLDLEFDEIASVSDNFFKSFNSNQQEILKNITNRLE